jgi:hypothetical protein
MAIDSGICVERKGKFISLEGNLTEIFENLVPGDALDVRFTRLGIKATSRIPTPDKIRRLVYDGEEGNYGWNFLEETGENEIEKIRAELIVRDKIDPTRICFGWRYIRATRLYSDSPEYQDKLKLVKGI